MEKENKEEKNTEEFEENDGVDLPNLAEANPPNPNYNFVTERKKSKKTLYLIILVIIILTVVGAFIFNKKFSKQATPTSTPTPVPTPTSTPKPALIRSDWSLEVLNGSGVSGLAKKAADKLKEMGYQVIKTGNADKDSYDKTQILVKKDLQDKVDLLIADLRDIIKIASVAGELKDSTASARIIIGKD